MLSVELKSYNVKGEKNNSRSTFKSIFLRRTEIGTFFAEDYLIVPYKAKLGKSYYLRSAVQLQLENRLIISSMPKNHLDNKWHMKMLKDLAPCTCHCQADKQLYCNYINPRFYNIVTSHCLFWSYYWNNNISISLNSNS